jgi:hypothetical protein
LTRRSTTAPEPRSDHPIAGGPGLAGGTENGPTTDECPAPARTDRHPRHWPKIPLRLLAALNELVGWVPEPDGEVLGHVAPHDAAPDPACETAQSQLISPPRTLTLSAGWSLALGTRARNVGPQLLDTATEAAHGQRQRPFLNVAHSLDSAIAMHDRSRWKNVGPFPRPLPWWHRPRRLCVPRSRSTGGRRAVPTYAR